MVSKYFHREKRTKSNHIDKKHSLTEHKERRITIYCVPIISCILYFPKELVFMPERSEGIIKLLREVKITGY